MAKTKKVAQKETVVVNTKTEQNRARRLAKHLKKHPKDAQAANAPKQAAVRRKPKNKGTAPQQVVKIRDNAGHVVHAGSIYGFVPDAPTKREERQKENQPFFNALDKGVAKFGQVPVKRTEQDIKEDVRAMCWALGIEYTGRRANEKRSKPRKNFKSKK